MPVPPALTPFPCGHVYRSAHSSLALACCFQAALCTARLSRSGQTCSTWHGSAVFFSLKPSPSANAPPCLCHGLFSIISFRKKGGNQGSVGPAREVRVTPGPDMVPSRWCLLLPCPLKTRAPHAGLLPRRFWYRRPVSCRVSPAEAEDIAEERGQSWSLLSLALTKNPANEEKSWTLHQAQTLPSSISVCHRDR